MSSFKHLIYIMGALGLMILTSCSSSSTSTGTSTTTGSSSGVTSLSQLPELTDMVSSSSESSASISGALFAVSGTAPALSDIAADDIDTLFWNGLLAELADATEFTSDQINDFWNGEGACRMAQEVGYSFQNLSQAGTSMCYMKNAPLASSGVAIVSGDITEDDLPTLFSQSEDTFIGKVLVSGEMGPEDEEMDQEIFIRVYGTGTDEGADGYRADLWFCADGSSTPDNYEEISVNTDTGVFTQNSYGTDFGVFSAQFVGNLTQDENGDFIFNPDETQSVQVYYAEEQDEFSFSFKSLVSTTDGVLTTKSWGLDEFDSQTNYHKVYSESTYSGASQDTFSLSSSEFTNLWSNGEEEDIYNGLVEFQDTLYAVSASEEDQHDFASDSFFDGDAPADDSDLSGNLAELSCSAEVSFVVSIDMSDEGFQEEVASECESHFNDMNFCDSDEVDDIRNSIFESEFFGEPE